MMMMQNIYVITALYLALLVACTEDKIEIPNTDVGYTYFPLEIGKYREYRMDSVLYDIRSPGEPSGRMVTGYIREVLVDTFTNAEQLLVYKWASFKRATLDLPWQQTGFVLEQRTASRALRTEDHLTFIKLVFPVGVDKIWEGHSFFDEELTIFVEGEPFQIFKGWGQYTITHTDLTLDVSGVHFTDVLRVLEAQSESVLDLRESESFYAKDVGLIKRIQRFYDVECNQTVQDPCHTPGTSWEDDAERGFSLTQELIRYN